MATRIGLTSLLFASAILVIPVINARAEVSIIDEIVATVNGSPIMLSEIRTHIAGHGQVTSRKDLTKGSVGGAVLDQAILKRLVQAEAAARHITVADGEITGYIDQVKTANNITEERLLDELKRNHKSLDEYKEDLRQEILTSKLAGAYARDTIAVAQDEVESYLEEHSPHPSKIHLLKVSLPPEKFDKEIVEQVQIKMSEGATIKQIERELEVTDITSDFGMVAEKDLTPEIYALVKDLKDGDFSEIAQGDSTWDFYGVLDRTTPEPYSDAEFEEAREVLKKSKVERSITEFFLTELPKKYPVERMN
jgi:peptidyl-prolyl cis-trans isomerase SurA